MKINSAFLMILVSGSFLSQQVNTVEAGSWPRFLGPEGANHVEAAGFNPDLSQWKTAWTAEVGLGYASIIVSGNRAWTLGHNTQGQETLYCFEADTGKVIWKTEYAAELLPRMHVGGPNASPTLTDAGLVSVSKDGQVMLVNPDNGEILWKQELGKILNVETPTWGFASSPVVDGGRIYLEAGKVAALDLKTGATVWTSEKDYHPGYTTVVPFENSGKGFIASLGGKELIILNKEDGKEVAHHPFKARFDMLATTPVISKNGSHIYISGNSGSEMLKFDGQKLEVDWASRDIKSSLNNPVVAGAVMFGVSGNHKQSASELVAFNATDGSVRWNVGRFGYGSTIGVGETLLVLTEEGDLVTAPLKAEAYKEISRVKVLDSICWTAPSFANGRIYVRNDQGKVVCLAQE